MFFPQIGGGCTASCGTGRIVGGSPEITLGGREGVCSNLYVVQELRKKTTEP